VLRSQRNEITEHLIYTRLAAATREPANRRVLERIAADELRHYGFWKRFTGSDVAPDRLKAGWFVLMARLLGLTFAIKLMERGEEGAQEVYSRLSVEIPEARRVVADEDSHEDELIAMLDEERLRYVGSVVLGLNDALVELTGALAGLTLALQNTRLIGTAGLITGIAASLSMAASEYLSTQSEKGGQDPVKASLYTGAAYVFTVVLLIAPYFLAQSYLLALGWTVLNAIAVILFFSYYVSVAQDVPFRGRFVGMAAISLGVAALSFGIGWVVREVLGVEI
jgi:VIT1/CCC1 family predicted Fe2+/Mn2+ transporter